MNAANPNNNEYMPSYTGYLRRYSRKCSCPHAFRSLWPTGVQQARTLAFVVTRLYAMARENVSAPIRSSHWPTGVLASSLKRARDYMVITCDREPCLWRGAALLDLVFSTFSLGLMLALPCLLWQGNDHERVGDLCSDSLEQLFTSLVDGYGKNIVMKLW